MASETKSFNKSYSVISLPYEYKGYQGKIRYAIVTDLTEDELISLYADEIEQYRPFVIITREMRLAMRIYDRNENKHRMRQARGERLINDELDYSCIYLYLIADDEQTVLESKCDSEKIIELCKQAMLTLDPKEYDCLVRHFIEGTSIRVMAREDNVNKNTILHLCKISSQKFIEAYRNLEEAS